MYGSNSIPKTTRSHNIRMDEKLDSRSEITKYSIVPKGIELYLYLKMYAKAFGFEKDFAQPFLILGTSINLITSLTHQL